MAIVELSNELILKKRELLIELDKCQDADKKILLQKQIGDLEQRIYQNTMEKLKKIKTETPTRNIEQKKEYTARELRKIVNEKRNVYKELALQSRKFYKELVEKKREGEMIKNMISEKDKRALKLALEY